MNGQRGEAEQLYNAYASSLALHSQVPNAKSIAFVSMGTGVYKWPIALAADKVHGLRFDWYQPTDAEFIDELAATVIDVVNEKRSTRGLTPEQAIARAEEEQLIAKHIIGSLYHAHSSINSDNSRTPIVIPRAKESYAKNSSDSTKVNYSYRCLDNIYRALIELKWIEVSLGNTYKGYTRAHASGQLAETFRRVGLVWTKQQPIDKSGRRLLGRRPTVSRHHNVKDQILFYHASNAFRAGPAGIKCNVLTTMCLTIRHRPVKSYAAPGEECLSA